MAKPRTSSRLPDALRVLQAYEEGLRDVTPPPTDRHPVLAGLEAMEPKLVAAGFPPLSGWWWGVIRRFYESGCRWQIARVGRGGGKSTSTCRVAVAEMLYGDHPLNPGDKGVVPIISVSKSEAADRLTTIKAILDALGEPYDEAGTILRLRRKRIEVRVYAATVSGVSGFTTIFGLCDEVAKWRDSSTGANPATQVLASLRPTMRGRPNSHLWLVSSPVGTLDAHAKAFDEGDNARQLVAYAPTWEANPTLSEEQTHVEEPDPDIWAREWKAIPIEGAVESLFSGVLLDGVTRVDAAPIPFRPGWYYIAVIDPATRGNAWTLAIATVDPQGVRIIVYVKEWRGSVAKPLRSDELFQEISGKRMNDDGKLVEGRFGPGILPIYGLNRLWTDQWAFDSLADHARNAGLTLLLDPQSAGEKLAMYEDVARDAAVQKVSLPKHPAVRADLLSVHRRVTPTGITLFLMKTPDGRHSDFAPSVGRCLTLPIRAPSVAPPQTSEEREAAQLLKLDLKRYGGRKSRRHLPGC